MTEQKLTQLLEKGDDQRCIAFFQNMNEKQRRALAPYCQKWFKEVSKEWLIQVRPNTFKRNPLVPAAEIAMFATATLSELRKQPFHTRPDDDHICQLLMDRQPKWVSQWVPTLLDEPNYWQRWTLIRRLISAGLAEKPEHPNYYLAMISGLGGRRSRHNKEVSIEQSLREDPGLLEDEVWRLFEYDGGGENSLANWDRFTRSQTWNEALVSLAKKGHLPRRRLLDCALEALERDFNHYRAKWFATFYDSLQPSPEEQLEHADRYLGLLDVSAPNIVSWAFTRVQAANKEGVYATDKLVAGLQLVLEARSKGIVKKTLKLLERVAKQDPESSHKIAQVAVTAVGHEQSDVQAAALDLIDKCVGPGDEQLASLLTDYLDVVAPSLRQRLTKWCCAGRDASQSATPQDAARADTASDSAAPLNLADCDPAMRQLLGIDALVDNVQQQRFEIPAASFDGTDIPRLDPQQRLTPIDNLDDLIDICARVVEDGSRVDDAELAMDALARLCGQKPEDFEKRVAPLLKRVRQQLRRHAAPFIGFGPSYDLCGLIYAWLTGTVIRGKQPSRGSCSFSFEFEGKKHAWHTRSHQKAIGHLSRRSLALAETLATREPTVLLSAPTHSGGWIDPRVLVERVNQWSTLR